VKAGENILITERNLVVAQLLPPSVTVASDGELLRLAAQGKIRLGKGPIDNNYWKLKLPRVKIGSIKARNVLQWMVDEERNEE
jgi:antitoxin (DNA-binding transcriptional repressor) of toxin-antitoxin stability system